MFKTTIAAALIVVAAGTANAKSAASVLPDHQAQAKQATRECTAEIEKRRHATCRSADCDTIGHAFPFEAYYDGEYYHVRGFPNERWDFFKCLNDLGFPSHPASAD